MRWVLHVCVLVCALCIGGAAQAQRVPKDFKLELTAGPIHEYMATQVNKVTIIANGQTQLYAWDSPYGQLPAETVQLKKKAVRSIYKALAKARVFDFKDTYINYQIAGGDVSTLKMTAGGKTKSIRVANLRLEDFKDLIFTINKHLPVQRWILTRPMVSDDGEFPQVQR